MSLLTEEQQKLFKIFTTKPLWMKKGVLTERGWRHPETQELLVGRRTPQWILDHLKTLEAGAADVVEHIIEEVKEVVSDVSEALNSTEDEEVVEPASESETTETVNVEPEVKPEVVEEAPKTKPKRASRTKASAK